MHTLMLVLKAATCTLQIFMVWDQVTRRLSLVLLLNLHFESLQEPQLPTVDY